jgi:hypothetical protein
VNAAVGEPVGIGSEEVWTRLAGRQEAGVFRAGGWLVARNRPVAEDGAEFLEEAAVRGLFGDVSVRLFEERAEAETKVASEVWRWFLVAMLALLVAEAAATLPGRAGPATAAAEGVA